MKVSTIARTAKRLCGGILPPVITPYHADFSIDYNAYRANIRRLRVAGCSGVVVGGSNGEYVLHSSAERVECVRQCRQALSEVPHMTTQEAAAVPIIAGCCKESTQATIDLAKRMVEAGATGLLLLHPSYFKGTMATEEAQRVFFSEVAQALQPTPIVLYNMPANTGIDLSAGLVASLARAHSNIVGFKDSGGNIAKLASIAGQLRQSEFSLLAGSAGFLLPAMMAGATGGICAYANLDPAPLLELVRLAEEAINGTAEAATGLQSAVALQQRVVDLNTAITATYGVAGLKYCMWKKGFLPSPRARKPLLPLPARAQEVLDELMALT